MPSRTAVSRSECDFLGYVNQDVAAGVYTIRLRTSAGGEVDITSKPPKNDGKERSMVCDRELPGGLGAAPAGATCRAAYTSRQQLKEHVDAFHNFSLVCCKGCAYQCVDPSNIKKHEAKCDGVAAMGGEQYEYACGYPRCDYVDHNCSNVTRHMRSSCSQRLVEDNRHEPAYKATRRLKQQPLPLPSPVVSEVAPSLEEPAPIAAASPPFLSSFAHNDEGVETDDNNAYSNLLSFSAPDLIPDGPPEGDFPILGTYSAPQESLDPIGPTTNLSSAFLPSFPAANEPFGYGNMLEMPTTPGNIFTEIDNHVPSGQMWSQKQIEQGYQSLNGEEPFWSLAQRLRTRRLGGTTNS